MGRVRGWGGCVDGEEGGEVRRLGGWGGEGRRVGWEDGRSGGGGESRRECS